MATNRWPNGRSTNTYHNFIMRLYVLLICRLSFDLYHVAAQDSASNEFSPQVSATCRTGIMNIKVAFNNSYSGAIHTRDHRTSSCMQFGDGSNTVSLSLNLLAREKDPDYCGILVHNRSEERSVQLAVRVHRTLELADDKFYVITCGKAGFNRDENSVVVLKFLENQRRVRETVYGREYAVKVELTQPNGTHGIKVKNCFAFNKKNTSIPLIDNRGCPVDPLIISRFETNADRTQATAHLHSMFKFPEGSEVHIQCDVAQCVGGCAEEVCPGDVYTASSIKGGRPGNKVEDGSSLAATTVFVLDPDKAPQVLSPACEEGSIRPSWLLWLCITLGILFLIMLLMNIFLCTAMSCSCARTEIIEKEPSIIEEYDPYRSWHGSQYGSRYSLHGRDGHKGYTSGGSTIHSNRSLPNDTDHYAIVHSRPGSRHSGIVNGGHRSLRGNH
ncbi:uncharacterized protein LOC116341958 isoform X2 [Contarinia nasturtii]|uniref:uncharacterized protein LOC116341958 isoform X2 n=1 Tax=Contarinia nasturtii TaxID=265458 RepID=UPI0012D4AA8D|nr:uncharacterized protein LOC116341958 isoform X2 [Contarinia nasturtii]